MASVGSVTRKASAAATVREVSRKPVVRGQGKPEGGAQRPVRRSPKMPFVCLDDRAADREAHPRTPSLCRKTWTEDPFEMVRLDSLPGILHRYQHAVGVLTRGCHAQDPWLLRYHHRLDRVGDQVE